MSNINPANINGSYPIAGQDNDSQGFRDNFTNIKTNLTYAKNELEDLAAKVVVKQPLTVNSNSSVENNMEGTVMSNVVFDNARYLASEVSIDSDNVATIDVTNSLVKLIETAGFPAFNIDVINTNPTVSGRSEYAAVKLQIIAQEPTQVITFPVTVINGKEYIEGFSGDELTLVGGTVLDPIIYWFELSTVDNWTTVTITDLTRPPILTVTHATTASTVTSNAQPNITSVGVLTELKMIDTVGNAIIDGKIKFAEQADTALDAAHATTANTSITASTVTSNAQPNITSVGTLTSLSISGNLASSSVTTTYAQVTGQLTVGSLSGVLTVDISEKVQTLSEEISGTVTYNYPNPPTAVQILMGNVTVNTTGWTAATQEMTVTIDIPVIHTITVTGSISGTITPVSPGRYTLHMENEGGGSISTVFTQVGTLGTFTLDCHEASFFRLDGSEASTLSATNWPVSNTYGKIRLLIYNAVTTNNVTLPASVTIGNNHVPGLTGSTFVPPANGSYMFELSTFNGGSSVIILPLLAP